LLTLRQTVGGWSFGGVCAQEMASMLVSEWAAIESQADAEDASRHVDVLMIDSFRPVTKSKTKAAVTASSPGSGDTSPSLPPPTPSTTAAAQQSVSSNVALRKLGGATLAHLCDQHRLATHMLRRHVPRPLAQTSRSRMRVHLLKAAKLGPMPRGVSSEMRMAAVKRLCAKHNGWDDEQLAPGLALPDGQTVAASHDDMFSEANLGDVTAWLRERLALAEARR
jgi:thioesterase domain-containing protein